MAGGPIGADGGSDPDADGPRGDPTVVLSRTQVALYALLGLFVGTVATALLRPTLVDLAGPGATTWYGVYGVLVGTVFAAVVALAATRITEISERSTERIHRLHTASLAVAVLVFLLVASVAPGLIGLQTPRTDGLVGQIDLGNPALGVAPVAAAGATLVVLGGVYVGLRRRARGHTG